MTPFDPVDSRFLAHPLSRRSLLLGSAGLAGAVALGACGDDSSADGNPGTGDGGGQGTPALVLTPVIPREGLLIAGEEQRIPILLTTSDGGPADDAPDAIEVTVAAESGPLGTVDVESFGEGLDTRYYPVPFVFPEPALYQLQAAIDGEELEPLTFEVSKPGAVPIPGTGDDMVSIPTPTVDDARGVDPICTRDPVCDLHALSLEDSLSSDRKTALLIATPAFCQTAVCGPVLDIMLEQVGDHPDIDFIHAEVYANPEAVDNIAQADLAEAPTSYALPFEPALFLADADGVVTERVDTIYGSRELDQALARLDDA